MKANDIPCPYPEGYKSGEPLKENTGPDPSNPVYHPWGPKGGHLESADKEFIDSIWNVPDGRRSR